MPKVVSIIPFEKDSDTGAHKANGTKVLLDDGSYLQGVQKITLVAKVGGLWGAIIEVMPTNQQQISAELQAVHVVTVADRKAQIKKEVAVLTAEHDYLESLTNEQ